MKFFTRILLSSLMALVLLAGVATPAFAALGINSVTPSTVINDMATTITLTGTDFDDSAAVLLDGYGALATSFLNNQTLTAIVPAGTPVGDYTVRVNTSAPESITWSGTLHVKAPAPTAEPTLPAFGRPQMVIDSYSANVDYVHVGDEFKLKLTFANAGNAAALNAQATFSSSDMIPTKTGGVIAVGSFAPGASGQAAQTFQATDAVYGKALVTVDVTLTYYDDKGASYSDKFTLTFRSTGTISGSGSYATATPTGVNSAQLVITSYATTVDPLQPGAQFELGMTVQNMGNTTAQRVTMIVGGGSSGGSSSEGTPAPGGTSGGSGEFTNFAPVGSSNIQSLGDLGAGRALQVRQSLIVNVSTNPGAYPMRITFSYVNSKGEVVNDDQVITLLVYSLPILDISFYRDPGVLFSGQPNMLPIQVVNLGKRSAVLGDMIVETSNGTLETPSTLVGAIDQGGYFTFDASYIPETPGPVKLNVTIKYTDDFNQPRTYTDTIDVTVEEAMLEPGPEDPGMNGGGGGGGVEVPVAPESLFQKAWRFLLGLLGLDSSSSSGGAPVEPMPSEEKPIMPAGPGGKG